MNGNAVFENVRRYRAIASLYRQTAAFRPSQRPSLLQQAFEWEDRAVLELEAHYRLQAQSGPLHSQAMLRASSPMLNAA
jgi:hypothetical protein